MTDQTQQQTRNTTPQEDIRELYSRVAKLNDIASALLAPEWGSEVGIIPTGHPLYVGEKRPDQEQDAPVDWQGVVKRRERELKKVGEARHRAEAAIARIRALADEHPVAIPTHLVDEALDQTAGEPAAVEPGTRYAQAIADVQSSGPAARHDDGPSIAEAAADDRTWDLRKAGE